MGQAQNVIKESGPANGKFAGPDFNLGAKFILCGDKYVFRGLSMLSWPL